MGIKMRLKKSRRKKMTKRQKAIFGEKGDKVVVLSLEQFKKIISPR